MARSWGLLGSILLLGGCVHALTGPPGPSCARFMHVYDPPDAMTAPADAVAASSAHLTAAPQTLSPLEEALQKEIAQARIANLRGPAQPLRLDVLVLSGGGPYGAYGAGFLTGLYGAGPPDPSEIALKDYDAVTGISTGAIMTTYVWGAIILAGRPAAPPGPNAGLHDLASLYQVTDKNLFVKHGLLTAILGANALYDPRGRLETRVHDGVAKYAPLLRSADRGRVDIGAVNVRDGKFYRFDLKAMADADPPALACYSEAVLASAAIPLAFPPRYIDAEPYYDGGIRFGAYYDAVLPRLRRMALAAGRPLELNIRVIFNGNHSPNDPGADAAQASACDRASVAAGEARCPPIANSLLGSFTGGAGASGLLPRTVLDIMVDQLKHDAVNRIYNDWRAAADQGSFRYTFIPNAEMANPPSDAGVAACQKPASSTDQFDLTFMNCLFAVGKANGSHARWSYKFTKVGGAVTQEP